MDYILNFQFNSLLGICLYWIPLVFCMVFYTVRTAAGYMADKAGREKDDAEREKEVDSPYRSTYHYYPKETIGRIIGRALVSVMPIANIWAALFDLSPKVFGRFFELVGQIFDQPLVPKRERK